MKHNFNKILSIVLVVMMCLSTFPMGVLAAEDPVACPECFKTDRITKVESRLTATCTELAGTWYECGYEHEDGTVYLFPIQTAPAHHLNPEKVIAHGANPATHTTAGNSAYWECTECGKFFSEFPCVNEIAENSWIIPADEAAHTLGAPFIVGDYVCGAEGIVERRECVDFDVCGYYEEVTLPVLQHNWTIVTEGLEDISCLVEVEITFACARDNCNETKTVDGYGWAHELENFAANGATCSTDGNVEYNICKQCVKTFAADGVTEIAIGSWIVPAGHTLTHHAASAPSCETDGNIEYWTCSGECGLTYADADATTAITDTVDPMTGHSTVLQPANAATCTAAGNNAYYTCANGCGFYFSDAEATTKVDANSWVLPAIGHNNGAGLTFHAAEDATCDATGKIAYYSCEVCNTKYSDAEGTTVITVIDQAITVPNPNGTATEITVQPSSELYNQYQGEQHNWEYQILSTATCTLKGAIAWVCADCNEYKGAGLWIAYTISETNHPDMEYADRVESTCTEKGDLAYAYCYDCNKYFQVGADGKANTTVGYDWDTITANFIDALDIDADAHVTVAETDAVAATCFAAGNVKYGYCADCNKYFAIAEDGTYSDYADDTLGFVVEPHAGEEVAAVASADCQTKGYYAYYKCTVCNLYYAYVDNDPANAIIETTSYDDVEALAYYADHVYTCVPDSFTCGVAGFMEHYECDVCDKWFISADADTYVEDHESLAEGPTGNHDKYTKTAKVECEGENKHGTAGVIACRDCDYFEIVDQHNYTIKVYTVEPTCTTAGSYKLECSRCHVFQLDDQGQPVVKTEATARPHTDYGTPTFVPAVAPECGAALVNGNVAYYVCKKCGGNFEDAAMTVALDDVTDYAEHTVVPYAGTTATECGGEFEKAQYQCTVCLRYSETQDFATSQDTPYVDTLGGHTAAVEIFVAYQDSDCMNVGTLEIKHCTGECGKFYVNNVAYETEAEAREAAAITELKAHNGFVEGFDATCTATGEVDRFECTMCSTIYAVGADGQADETQVLTDVTIEKTAHVNDTFHGAVAPKCTSRTTVENGNIAYWECECGFKSLVEDAPQGTDELDDADIVVTHSLTPTAYDINKLASTCEDYGYITKACNCGYEYVEFSAPLLHNVTLKNEEAVDPTCSTDGKMVFYYCANCRKSYSDAACQNEVTNNGVIIDSAEKAVLPKTNVHLNAARNDITAGGCNINADYVCIYGEKCSAYNAETAKADLRWAAHNKGVWTEGYTAANCVNPESWFNVCPACGYIDETSMIVGDPANGVHPTDALIWRETAASTNCYTPAVESEYCQVCMTYTGNTRNGDTLDHDYEAHEDSFTCTTAGMKAHYTCKYEGCNLYFDIETKAVVSKASLEVAAGTHDYDVDNDGNDDWTIVKPNDYTAEDAEKKACVACGDAQYRPLQDVKFSATIDSGVVAGAELVNSGLLKVTVTMSAYQKMANAFTVSFNYSNNLTLNRVEMSDAAKAIGATEYSAVDGTFTFFTMNLAGENKEINGQDVVYATVYFNISADTAAAPVVISNIVSEIYDIDGDLVLSTTDVTGVATLTQEVKVLGNANGDALNVINLLDAQAMMKNVNGKSNGTYEYNALQDFNKDGDISVAEFAALRKFIAGTIDYNTLIGAN